MVFQKGQMAWNKGLTKEDERVRKYALNENTKKTQYKKGIDLKLERNPNWKGGRIKIWDDKLKGFYIQIRTSEGYVNEHRLVMEKHIGRKLLPTEIVHHINGNTEDNRIENLQLIESFSKHMKIHHQEGTR